MTANTSQPLSRAQPHRSTQSSTFASPLFTLLLSACSTEQAYNAGQAWQRNQCSALPDKAKYDRCISRAGTGYETWRRERAPDGTRAP